MKKQLGTSILVLGLLFLAIPSLFFSMDITSSKPLLVERLSKKTVWKESSILEDQQRNSPLFIESEIQEAISSSDMIEYSVEPIAQEEPLIQEKLIIPSTWIPDPTGITDGYILEDFSEGLFELVGSRG
ncbi:MAG: hypothetical protein ACFE9L_14665 [Candidatus Hodarchaeota archaeon]